MTIYRSILLAALVFTAAPAWAQQAKTYGTGIRLKTPAKPIRYDLSLPQDISQKRVTLSLKNATAEEALTQLLDLSGYGYEFDSAFYSDVLTSQLVNGKYIDSSVVLDLPPRRVTMKIVNAPLNKALESVCRALGVSWTVSTGGDSNNIPTITIQRDGSTVTRADLMKKQAATSGFGGGVLGGGLGGGGFGVGTAYTAEAQKLAALPSQQVTLDATNKPVRELLIHLLKSANVEYAFDDDVAEAPAVTVALNNVSIFTALNALCESAGLGWTTEHRQISSHVGKTFIRVGKIYATKTQ